MSDEKWKYYCVPFTGSTMSGDKSPGRTLADQLSKLLEDATSKGWEFYRVDTVRVDVKPGCLGALFYQQTQQIAYDIVVFRKKVS